MLRSPISLLFFGFLLQSTNAITMSKIASYAHGLIEKAAVPGVQTRVCSCQEQKKCADEMQHQAHDCATECISYFSQVTSTPKLLVPCYKNLVPQINGFSECMDSNLKSCVVGKDGPQQPYTSLTRLLELLEAEAIDKKEDIMSQQMVSKIKPVAEAAFSFAGCVKQCFVAKNSGGYCYDRVHCQPLITAGNLFSSLKKCSRGFNWKKEAGALCGCAQAAGVTGLQDVCPLLKTMTG